jgi:hypothetical protein
MTERWRTRLPARLWPCLLLLLPGCGHGSGGTISTQPAAIAHGGPVIALADVTHESGIRFTHVHGGSGTHYYVETMGGGCAFLDHDGDGWLDIFLVQGAPLPGYKAPYGTALRDALYHNNRDGTFTDVTDHVGLGDPRYGMGCCTGDFDNDGDTDLFVTNLEGNALYRNNGDGTFTDVAKRAGIGGDPLCTCATFFDYDRDGHIDLFISRYMNYDLESNPRCQDQLRRPSYCSPHVYEQTGSLLYRNNGDGTFTDVSAASGIAAASSRALGVIPSDFNGDGWIDLFVASDLSANLLFLNNGDGTFREEATLAGVAYGSGGAAMAGMGVDAADFNHDGQMDLVVTNFEKEPVSLYRNSGEGYFLDLSVESRLGTAGMPYLKWGVKFVDLDRDGFPDVFMANGHVDDHADERGGMGYAQPCRVYRNNGNQTFSDVSEACGPFFARRQVARGVACGDYDNDGDIDILVACNNQPAILLRNDSPSRHRWVRLALRGRGCNRDALGARVRVGEGSTAQTQYVGSGGSYLADHDRRLLFGISKEERARVEIRWPCGALQNREIQPGASIVIEEAGCRLARVQTLAKEK